MTPKRRGSAGEGRDGRRKEIEDEDESRGAERTLDAPLHTVGIYEEADLLECNTINVISRGQNLSTTISE